MKMGKSKPWPQALKKLTGSETLDVGALAEYFEPLRNWMVRQRKEKGYAAPGWDEEDATSTAGTSTLEPATAGISTLESALFNTITSLLFALVVFFR